VDIEAYDIRVPVHRHHATHVVRVPLQRRHALAGRHVPHLERAVARRGHDAPPVRKHGNAIDLRRRHIITKVPQNADAATHAVRVPFQRRHAFAGLDVPHHERVVPRRRHNALPVRKHGNANDLRRSQIITEVQWTPQRTRSECPFSVATHLPVATSQTLSVLSCDADTTRRPSGNTATHMTYDEDTSSK
jgi:hypothetical protein